MVSAMPRVSIGLPVYNGEKYLEEALDSILAQNYGDFELIISDNASTDGTQEICLKYAQKDRRIKYHRNDTNLGAAPNHNLVFRMATGEYFKWVGYDDKILPDFLLRCVEVLDNNPDVVLCMPKSSLMDEHGKYVGEFDYKADADSQEPQKRFRNFILHNESGNYVYGLMRLKSVAQTALQGSFPSADLVFLAELTLYGKYHIVPERLFFRRKHAEQSTKGTLNIERARIVWFDTSLKNKVVLPKWQYLFGYLNAVKNAPINSNKKMYCYVQIIRWALILPHFRALGKDVLLASRNMIIHSFLRIRNGKQQPVE